MVSLLSQFAAGQCADNTLLGFLPWYHYLNLNSQCGFDASHPFVLLGGNSSILLVLLAVVDDLFRAIGLLAVVFIIYAGFKFILSRGAPEETAKARTTALNALVGLGISMVAIAFVSFMGARVDNRRGGQIGHLNVSPLPYPTGVEGGSLIQTALSVAFGIAGAIAFLIIVIAGMQYVFSQGDPQATKKSKDTIIYALVGLVLAIIAQSVVSFALSRTP